MLFDAGLDGEARPLRGDPSGFSRVGLTTRLQPRSVFRAALTAPPGHDPVKSIHNRRKTAMRTMDIERRHFPSPQNEAKNSA